MSAAEMNINVEQGAELSFRMTITTDEDPPQRVNLTGHVFGGLIKDPTAEVAAMREAPFDFNVLDQTSLATRGQVDVVLAYDALSELDLLADGAGIRPQAWVYDIFSFKAGGARTKWLYGVAFVIPEVK